jgi:hypothetical protein
MTLDALVTDLATRFRYIPEPDAATRARFVSFLNEIHRDILSQPGLASLLRGTITFTSATSTPEYGLPPSIARVWSIRDTSNDDILVARNETWYRTTYPDPANDTGTPTAWVSLGIQSVARRPSDASEVFLKSTSASDTQTAYLDAVTSLGETVSLSVTLTGTTAVSCSASYTTITQVTDLSLSSAAIGTVTLHEDSGSGTELARINSGKIREQRWQIALVPTPAAAITYTVDYERDIVDLSQPTDEPVLPARFHDLLATGARMREYEFKGDADRYGVAAAEYQHRLGHLRAFLGQDLVVPGGQQRGRSSFGANYPADRWA